MNKTNTASTAFKRQKVDLKIFDRFKGKVFENMARMFFLILIVYMPLFSFGQITGPSSSQSPYLISTATGVTYTSILSANDSINGYKMSGIPDGLGAFDNGDGT